MALRLHFNPRTTRQMELSDNGNVRKNMALVRLIAIISLIATSAHGAEVSKKSTAKVEKPSKAYNVTFSSVLTSSLHKTSDIDHQLSNEFSIAPTYSLGNGYTLLSSISGTKDLKGERKFHLGDASFGVTTTLRKFDKLKISGTALSTIPLSEGTKDYQQLRTSITLVPKLSYSAMKGLTLAYSPSAKVNFHKFKTSLTGASNTQYQLANTAVVSYSGLGWMAATATATYLRKFTYGGNSSDVYAFSQTLTFLPTDVTSVSIGHAFGANPLQPNGVDNDIEVFDSRKSSVFAGFSYTY